MHLGEYITTATGLRLSVHSKRCRFTLHTYTRAHKRVHNVSTPETSMEQHCLVHEHL